MFEHILNKWMKDFHILENKAPINIIPLIDVILVMCGILKNSTEPLCSK